VRPLWLAVPLVLVAGFACGGGSTTSTSTPTASSAATTPTGSVSAAVSSAPSPPASAAADVCALLPDADVFRATGYHVQLATPNNQPPFNYCTIYLDIPDCQMQCALSLEDLGPVDPNSYNTPDTFKSSLAGANPDANFTFGDGTFGPNSWLATAQSGQLPQWKVAYFQVNGVAFNLHSPLVPQYTLTETQVVDATKAVIANLNKSPLSS
jgi:hypothetical protein